MRTWLRGLPKLSRSNALAELRKAIAEEQGHHATALRRMGEAERGCRDAVAELGRIRAAFEQQVCELLDQNDHLRQIAQAHAAATATARRDAEQARKERDALASAGWLVPGPQPVDLDQAVVFAGPAAAEMAAIAVDAAGEERPAVSRGWLDPNGPGMARYPKAGGDQ